MSLNPLLLVLLLGMVAGLDACGTTTSSPQSPAAERPGVSGAAAPESGRSQSTASPAVKLGRASFPVELALTPAQWARGLSGRASLPSGTGMLFIFDEEIVRPFWMKDMRFPLDILWISAHCVVVDITHGAPPPAPSQAEADLPLYTPKAPALHVLEINAGEAQLAEIEIGHRVSYTGSISGRYGC